MAITVIIAACFALGAWGIYVGSMALEDASRGGPWIAVAAIATTTLSPALALLADPEPFRGLALRFAEKPTGWSLIILQASTAVLVSLSAAAIGALLVQRRPSIPVPVRVLLAYGLLMAFTSLWGGAFDPRQLIFPGLVIAAASCWATPPKRMTESALLILRVLLVGSLVVAITSPDIAFGNLTRAQGGRFFGVLQLSGLVQYPNTLGSIAAIALVLEIAGDNRIRRIPWIGLAATVLIWSQSRNAWLMVIAALAVAVLRRNPRERAFGIVTLVGAAALTVVASGGEKLFGLTGRDEVWAVSLDLFNSSPIVGHGLGSVRVAAEQNGILWAGTAHNQLAQSLAEGGVIGGLLSIGFFATAFRSSLVAWRHGAWLPMALSSALLVRSVFDVTLATGPEILILVSLLSVPWIRPGPSDHLRDGEPGHTARTARVTANGTRTARDGGSPLLDGG